MKRTVIPELLDSDAGTPPEIAASLRDLRWVNRWFGGVHTTAVLIRRAMRRAGLQRASVLSVASGDGFAIHAAVQELGRAGCAVDAVASDRSITHLEASPAAATVVADAMALPFPEDSFDFVECALFAHHLESEELVAFAREALRVARHALLVNDLRRSLIHLAFVYAGRLFYRSRLTRHDSAASVHRAYTPDELRAMLKSAGAAEVEVRHSWFFRMGAIAWKQR